MTALHHTERKYIATATAGILFFGTPHRGTKVASWGRFFAEVGKETGFGSFDGIMKDLDEESEHLNDLLYEFTCWLFRMSVPVVCFFELKETDYGRKVHLPGLHSEMVSCCPRNIRPILITDRL